MPRSMVRMIFAMVVSMSLAFGLIAGVGVQQVMAAGQPTAGSGYNPVASTPPDIGYCYPSGYNRNGWRCGWRLAQAPYNLGDYYYYTSYGTGGPYGYYYNGWWYTQYGTGGPGPSNGDYGGRPRYDPYYNYYNNANYCFYNGYYYPCY